MIEKGVRIRPFSAQLQTVLFLADDYPIVPTMLNQQGLCSVSVHFGIIDL